MSQTPFRGEAELETEALNLPELSQYLKENSSWMYGGISADDSMTVWKKSYAALTAFGPQIGITKLPEHPQPGNAAVIKNQYKSLLNHIAAHVMWPMFTKSAVERRHMDEEELLQYRMNAASANRPGGVAETENEYLQEM
jgi:hypothetical protein